MKSQCVWIDGSPVPDGTTVLVDHKVTEFRVAIRHMSQVSEETIVDLLQKKLEVMNIEMTGQTVFALGKST